MQVLVKGASQMRITLLMPVLLAMVSNAAAQPKLLLTTGKHPSEIYIYQCSLSPDSAVLKTRCRDQSVHFWDVKSGRLLRSFAKPSRTTRSRIIVDPSYRLHAVRDEDGKTVVVSNIASRKILVRLKGQFGHYPLGFGRDAKMVVTWDKRNTIRIWDVATSKNLITLKNTNRIYCREFPQLFLFQKTDGTLIVLNPTTKKMTLIFKGHTTTVLKAWVSQSGQRIASLSKAGNLRLWNSATGEMLAKIPNVKGADFGPLGKTLAIDRPGIKNRALYGKLSLYNATNGKLIAELPTSLLGGSINFSADGNTFALRRSTVKILEGPISYWQIWDVATGKLIATKKEVERRPAFLGTDRSYSIAVKLSDKGKAILTNLRTGKPIAELDFPRPERARFYFSPDSKFVVASNFDRKTKISNTRIWNAETGVLIGNVPRPFHSLQFSKDRKHFFTFQVGNRSVKVWKLLPSKKP
jgi:WD40 repeat protein